MLILKKLVEDVLFALAVDLIKSAFQRAFQFISKVIHNIRCKKKMEQKDFYSIYIQLDDIIYLFLDKYRQIACAFIIDTNFYQVIKCLQHFI